MKNIILSVILLFSWGVSADTQSDVHELIQNNIKYIQQENVDLAMSTLHRQSPVYESTKSAMFQFNKLYDLKYELLQYRFITEDKDYAYVRVLQRTTKISGPLFNNNDIDLFHVLKKDAGQWKIWTSVPLEVNYLDVADSKTSSSN